MPKSCVATDVGMPVLEPHRNTFRAFAETVVPEMAQLDASGWDDVERTIEHALTRRPPALRRQLGVLLRAIELLPRVRYGRGFASLDGVQREKLIDALQRSPVKLLRRGVWGLRTLVFMGYYTRAETMSDVGYRAHARGWDVRPGSDRALSGIPMRDGIEGGQE
jgi:hypothetical protein